MFSSFSQSSYSNEDTIKESTYLFRAVFGISFITAGLLALLMRCRISAKKVVGTSLSTGSAFLAQRTAVRVLVRDPQGDQNIENDASKIATQQALLLNTPSLTADQKVTQEELVFKARSNSTSSESGSDDDWDKLERVDLEDEDKTKKALSRSNS